MQENFIKQQAKQFAKIVHHSTSTYEILNSLKERLEKELQPYNEANKVVFVNFWKEELDSLFYDHLKKCKNPYECPQHKTNNNADFLVAQFSLEGNRKEQIKNMSKPKFDSDQNDLNYYFNASNIPNQELVFETYNYFDKGEGSEFFGALEFLNLLNWHYRFLNENVNKPFDVLSQFQSANMAAAKIHLLVGFILKWFGGYPVANLNAQYNTTLKLLESHYLNEIDQTKAYLQTFNDALLHGEELSAKEEEEKNDFESYMDFLYRFDKLVNSGKQTQELKNIGNLSTGSLNTVNNENIKNSNSDLLFFVSHSSGDKEIVDLFVDKILQLALRVSIDNIFCTSIQATTITSGEDFRKVIKEQLSKASHVIQIITQNYKESEVCLNEMGAAWVLNNKVIPFILTPITYTSVGFIHQPNQLLKLDESDDLLKFVDEMKPMNKSLNHSEVKRHIEGFIRQLKAIRNK